MNPNKLYPSQDPMVRLAQEMKLRRFSPRTVKSYVHFITDCLHRSSKRPREIQSADVRSYLEHLADQGVSASTLNSAYSALLFYFGKIIHRRFFVSIPRAKKEKKLPLVLSKNEVKKLLSHIQNPKHHCMASLLYGSGLRVGELVRLRAKNIDIEQGIIQVVQGKGGKDRITLLPAGLISVLAKQKAIKQSDEYLFTNAQAGRLTETTQIYTHVATRHLTTIPSPIDG